MKFSSFVTFVTFIPILFDLISGQFFNAIRNAATGYGNQLLSNVGISNSFNSNNGNNYQHSAQNYPQSPQTVQRYQQEPTDLSNCAPYFSYKTGFFGSGVTAGQLEIPNLDRMQNDIRAVMTVATKLSGDYGEISLVKSKEGTAADVQNGYPLQLKIRFPVQNPLPKIFELYLNDRLLCSEPKETGRYITTLTLSFKFISNGVPRPTTAAANYRHVPVATQPQTERTTATSTTTLRPYTTKYTTQKPLTTRAPTVVVTSSPSDHHEFDQICGVSAQKSTTGLVVNGNEALRGQFPWLVAYFYGEHKPDFICGGSLISTKVVVTAAHCVQEKGSSVRRQAKYSTFYLGKHNLDSLLENDYQTSVASELRINSEWIPSNPRYLGDIAIAVLANTISFNKYIKPICIWRASQSSDDIDGKEGIVAGWGKTELNAVSTSKPLYTKIPALTGFRCIQSDGRFNSIVSEKSFCAGVKGSDRGPCNGDSGGAFIVDHDGKSYLRGVVSSSLYDQAALRCDSKNYAVFTDVAKYTDWIDSFVMKYG